MGDATSQPLLPSSVSWADLEDGTCQSAITVQQLIALDPDHVIEFISKKGLVRLGSFKVQDYVALAALQDRPFLTIGCSERDVDHEKLWRTHLAKYKPTDRQQVDGWTRKLMVEAFVVNIKDAAAPDVEGLVNPLLLKYDAGGCHYSVFSLPAVQAVLQFKWDTYAGTWVRYEFGCFLVWLVSFSAFVLLYQDEDDGLSLSELLSTPAGLASVACQFVSLLAMLPFVLIEMGSAWVWGLAWLSSWNILDCVTYILQVAIAVLYIGRIAPDCLSILVAWQSVLLWFRLNYFSRLMGGHSFSIVDSMQQVLLDIRVYLVYLLIMMWGFACAYHVLFRKDQDQIEEFNDIVRSMLTLLTYASKGVDMKVMLISSHPDAAVMLSLLYQFSTVTVIMSMLTGVMVLSMKKAMDHEDMKRLLNKAKAIDELEGSIPAWIERLMPNNYPAFVHVLRVDPTSTVEEFEPPVDVLSALPEAFQSPSRKLPRSCSLAVKFPAQASTEDIPTTFKRTSTMPAHRSNRYTVSGSPLHGNGDIDAPSSWNERLQELHLSSIVESESCLPQRRGSDGTEPADSGMINAGDTHGCEGIMSAGLQEVGSGGLNTDAGMQRCETQIASAEVLSRQLVEQGQQLDMLQLQVQQLAELLSKHVRD